MTYIYPPRPEVMCAPNELSKYDNGEYIAQPKLNGSCAVLQMDGTGSSLLSNRHNDLLTNCKDLGFKNLYRGTGAFTIVGEYLNKNQRGYNGSDFNHRFIIFDILQYDNRSLVGTTIVERQNLLNELYGTQEMSVDANGGLLYDEFLWLTAYENIYRVRNYSGGFVELWGELVKHEVYEGLVLKRKSAKLEPGFREKNNTGWQVKCRKETKYYKF